MLGLGLRIGLGLRLGFRVHICAFVFFVPVESDYSERNTAKSWSDLRRVCGGLGV